MKLVNRWFQALMAFAVLLVGGLSARATDVFPDATASVSAASTLFAAIGVIAAAILLWKIGSRLASRYIK